MSCHVIVYSPSNHCVVLLFLSLLSGIRGVSIACRTPDSVLTGHKGEHLVIPCICQEFIKSGKQTG